MTLDYKNPQQIQTVVAKMQFSALTWHSFQCFFKYSSGLSFNTVGKQKRLSGKKRLPRRRQGLAYISKVNNWEEKKKSQQNRVKQQLHNMLKKGDRKEPGGLAGIQKRKFRDKIWSNFEPWRWTGWKKPQETDGNDIKGRAEPAIQRQSKHWLVILTTLLALSELC